MVFILNLFNLTFCKSNNIYIISVLWRLFIDCIFAAVF